MQGHGDSGVATRRASRNSSRARPTRRLGVGVPRALPGRVKAIREVVYEMRFDGRGDARSKGYCSARYTSVWASVRRVCPWISP